MGLADRLIDNRAKVDLVDVISERGADAALATLSNDASSSPLLAGRDWIDNCYEADTVEEIADRLRVNPSESAQQAAKTLLEASPTSLKVALRAVRAAKALNLEEALNQEFRLVSALLRAPDLVEGIRAQVIDKDRNPRWIPSTLADVTPDMVDHYFVAAPTTPFDLVATSPPTHQQKEAVQ